MSKQNKTKKQFLYTIAQSICTHYSCFEITGRFVTLKKNWVQNMKCKKQGAKNRVIPKKDEARLFSY
jgi:hypothetical protein